MMSEINNTRINFIIPTCKEFVKLYNGDTVQHCLAQLVDRL
jgi:hypothetical protein